MPFDDYLQSVVEQHELGVLSTAVFRQCFADLRKHHEEDLAEAVSQAVSAAVLPLHQEINKLRIALHNTGELTSLSELGQQRETDEERSSGPGTQFCPPIREDTGAGVWDWLFANDVGIKHVSPHAAKNLDRVARPTPSPGATDPVFHICYNCACCRKIVAASLERTPEQTDFDISAATDSTTDSETLTGFASEKVPPAPKPIIVMGKEHQDEEVVAREPTEPASPATAGRRQMFV